jgi:hypothetical protein
VRGVLWRVACDAAFEPGSRKAALVAASRSLSLDEAADALAELCTTADDPQAMQSQVAAKLGWPPDYFAAAMGPRDDDVADARRWLGYLLRLKDSSGPRVEKLLRLWRRDVAEAEAEA